MMALTFGLSSLVLLQLIVVRGRWPIGKVLLVFGCGLFVGVVLINAWLQPPRFLPRATTSGLSMGLAQGIREGLSDPETSEFVLIDGGSYTARGVDDQLLERGLSGSLKRKVKVLALSLPGGNHYERWSVLRNGLALLDADTRHRFEQSRITLLLEIHSSYDHYPLAQLRKNKYSDRAFAYLQPGVALAAALADHGPMRQELRRKMWVDVLSHGATNAFNVGAFHRFVPSSEVEPGSGYQALLKPARGYRYRGMRKAAAAFRERSANFPAGFPEKNIEARRRRIYKLLAARRPVRTIYYSTPSLNGGDLLYSYAFCRRFTQYACIDHAKWQLLKRLDSKDMWYDNVHMQRRGAELYSAWLARQLAVEMSRDRTEATR